MPRLRDSESPTQESVMPLPRPINSPSISEHPPPPQFSSNTSPRTPAASQVIMTLSSSVLVLVRVALYHFAAQCISFLRLPLSSTYPGCLNFAYWAYFSMGKIWLSKTLSLSEL